jgi:hypothetical protein
MRGLPVIAVEVAVDGDPATLGEGDRLLDLPALEVALRQDAAASPLRALGRCGV